MREAIVRVNSHALLLIISRMFFCVLINVTTSLSDCTATFGRQPVSLIVWWIRENTPLDEILQSEKSLWYSSTAISALPLQNPQTEIHVTIFQLGKHKRNFSNYSLLTVTVTTVDNEVAARMRCRLKDGNALCTGNATCETGSVNWTARRPHFTLAIISVTVQIRIQVFWVVSVYLNLRNILPNFGTFSPGYRVYVCVCMHAYMYAYMYVCSIFCRWET